MQIVTGIVALLTTEINYFHAKCYVKHPHQISDLTYLSTLSFSFKTRGKDENKGRRLTMDKA